MSRRSPSCPLKAGPVQTPWWEGMSRTARHGSGAAVAQTLLAGAGGTRGDSWGSRGGQWVGEVALPSHLASEPCWFVNLGQRCEIHYIIVSMWAQVSRALASLIAVLQKDGSSSLIWGPAAFIVSPLPVNTTTKTWGLGKQRPTYWPGLTWNKKRKRNSKWQWINLMNTTTLEKAPYSLLYMSTLWTSEPKLTNIHICIFSFEISPSIT